MRVTDIVSNFWDRLDSPPYFKSLNKVNSPPPTHRQLINTPIISPVKQQSIDSDGDMRSESPSLGFTNRQSSERSSCGSAKAFAETGTKFVRDRLQNKIYRSY